MNNRPIVILIGDGMGDFPLAELQGKTPLEAARTPAMDSVARGGHLFRLPTIPAGYPAGSDVANLSLLGYAPEKYYTGRAPLEAASLGIALASDQIAFRCNLVTLGRQDNGAITMVDYCSDHIETPDAARLIEELANTLNTHRQRFYPGTSYRHLFVIKDYQGKIATVPPHDHTRQDVSCFWQQYATTELGPVVVEAHKILSAHPFNTARAAAGKNPANGIWLWGEGKPPTMPSLQQQFGIEGTLISAVDLLKGIGVYAGMEIVNVPGATGYLDTNYQGKADAAIEAIHRNRLVLVHIEAPDEVSHQGMLKEKIQAIEDFDRKIVQPILTTLLDLPNFSLAIAMDHYTPISTRTHEALPVPIAILHSNGPKGSNLDYNEKNGEQGTLLAGAEAFFKELLRR